MEATGYAQWFERMLAKLGYELWIGDAAEIRAAMVREQKTDARDQQPCGTDLPLEMPVCLAAAQDFAGSSRIRRIEISGYRNACRSQLISGALRFVAQTIGSFHHFAHVWHTRHAVGEEGALVEPFALCHD
jgi:hypothetical protein